MASKKTNFESFYVDPYHFLCFCVKNELFKRSQERFTDDWLPEDILDFMEKRDQSEHHARAGLELLSLFEEELANMIYEHMPNGMCADQVLEFYSDAIEEAYQKFFKEICEAQKVNFDGFKPAPATGLVYSQSGIVRLVNDCIENQETEPEQIQIIG